MRISSCWLRRQIAICLVMFLAAPFGPSVLAQQTSPAQQAQPQDNESGITKQSATTQSEAAPANPSSALPQTMDENQQSSSPPTAPEQQQSGTTQPLGTAVAPYEKPIGVAASR